MTAPVETSRRAFLGGVLSAGLVSLSAGPSAEAAARRLPRASIAARRRFFGAANVDPRTGQVRRDRVVLAWFGVANFALAIDGMVVLLDAWVPRGPYSGVVPTSPAELALLKPSHLFIGHAHFDHAADAGPIAAAAGAMLVGTRAHAVQIGKQVDVPLRSRILGLEADGAQTSFALSRRVRVTAVRHPHSEVELPTGEFKPLLLAPDLRPILTNPPTLADLRHFVAHQRDKDGGTLLYRFQIGDFSLTWNDSAGPLATSPTALRALRSMPPSTVHVGAIQGFGQYTNGLRDPLDYIRAARPRVFVPGHHDNWAPPLSTPAAGYEKPLREALLRLPASVRPSLRFLDDPGDYIRPERLTFAV